MRSLITSVNKIIVSVFSQYPQTQAQGIVSLDPLFYQLCPGKKIISYIILSIHSNVAVLNELYVIYQTRNTVFDHIFQTSRSELKIRGVAEYFWVEKIKIRSVAEYFWRTSRCLKMWSKTVLGVWYIVSIKTKTKERMEI